MAGHKKIFISHIHEDDSDLAPLKNLLSDAGLEVHDHSINSLKPNEAESPEYIKTSILGPQINRADVFIVLITADTHESTWVDWEIRYAAQLGKRIIGVWGHGSKDSDLPPALEELGDDRVVAWRGEAIRDAILDETHRWESVDGSAVSRRTIPRHDC